MDFRVGRYNCFINIGCKGEKHENFNIVYI
jgi:hypothetical protein